ncbi:MAG: FAD-dependent oxidoreductase [Bdellovibrionota bacterium]
MKKIAIIGAGISGLKAALELVGRHQIYLFEKSPSVGGRVATRRFGDFFINHGAERFDGLEGNEILPKNAATDFPKAMRDQLIGSPDFSANFKTKAVSISKERSITFEDGKVLTFDQIIITAPIPQVRDLLKAPILPEIKYSKQISFIGISHGQPVKHMLTENDSEWIFEESDDYIREYASALFEEIDLLDLKKWRYSRVIHGHKDFYYAYTPEILICGDAFDPEGHFNLGSAWKSGEMTARKIV